jgi:hypothetical protein
LITSGAFWWDLSSLRFPAWGGAETARLGWFGVESNGALGTAGMGFFFWPDVGEWLVGLFPRDLCLTEVALVVDGQS